MSSKKFLIFSLIAASLVFAILSGGCGGSSGNIIQPDNNNNSDDNTKTGSDLEKFFVSNDHLQ